MVDLGSGMGGSSHTLAQLFGVHVTSLNILESQNEVNRQLVIKLGLGDKVKVVKGSYDAMPTDWSGRFDVVWSMEAFLHEPDERAAIAEAFRVTKPRAVFLFSDVIVGSFAAQEEIKNYQKRNKVTSKMYTVQQPYEEEFSNAGFVELTSRTPARAR